MASPLASPAPLSPPLPPPSRRRNRLSSFHIPSKSPAFPAQPPSARRELLPHPTAATPRRALSIRDAPPPPPSSSNIAAAAATPPPSTLPRDRRRSARPRPAQLSRAEIDQMYSHTIKLCQDNKINARNTWTLNLIDYMPMLFKTAQSDAQPVERVVSFDDRPPDHDDMNFHRAGVTLDAGVKIYCSRVDSVHVNAFKVLGGLSRTGREAGDADPDADADVEGDDDADAGRKRKAKRTGRCTLEGNMANITAQKLETDLAVDPLFQKMSAAFDEGGARGMLLNNLPIGPKGQVVFDSGELADSLVSAQAAAEEGEEEKEEEEGGDAHGQVYDVSDLLPNQAPSEFEVICASFLRFYRARKAMFERAAASASSEVTDVGGERSSQAFNDDLGDSHVEFDYSNDDLQNAEAMGVFASSETPADTAFQGMEDDDDVFLGAGDAPSRQSLQSNMSFLSTRRASLDLVECGLVALSETSDYSFFDTSSIAGWAGPQHWRFRAAEASASGSEDVDSSKKKAKRPRGKNAMLLDFSQEAPKINFKKEFAQGKKTDSYHLSQTVQDALSEKKVTLPEDLHFTVRALTSLFLKPRTFVRPKDAAAKTTSIEPTGSGDGQNDWYDFDNDCDNENFCPGNANDFTNEEMIEPESSDATGIDLIPEPTRVDKIDINYARVAKKVDVRQLKTGMWSRLCGDLDTQRLSEVCDEDLAKESGPDIREGSTQTLREVVQELPSFVPESSLQDVSLPYVFICLLHLANEKTLDISQSGGGSLTDLVITSGAQESV